MFGRDRRGFDWKEIAEVLHLTKTPARAAFWSEIKRARFKDLNTNSKENSLSGVNCPARVRTIGRRILRLLSQSICKGSGTDRSLNNRDSR